jgi:molecular chaperone GrpE
VADDGAVVTGGGVAAAGDAVIGDVGGAAVGDDVDTAAVGDVDADATSGVEAEAEAEANADAETDGQPDPLAQAQAESDELRDRYTRLQAEWDNFRKRTAVEREQERARAAEGLVERLLPVVDDLERAIEHSGNTSDTSLREGVVAVLNKLTEVLERAGVKVIDPLGTPFDANLHHAVGKEDNASVPDETVTQVYQKGYEMGGRVLRSAMVVVSQGGPIQDED